MVAKFSFNGLYWKLSLQVIRARSRGLPSPRSTATNVFSPTPAKSASFCWFTPRCFRLSLMMIPISFVSISQHIVISLQRGEKELKLPRKITIKCEIVA